MKTTQNFLKTLCSMNKPHKEIFESQNVSKAIIFYEIK